MKAKFQIENVHSAEPALQPSCTFTERGGRIGSAIDAAWRIQDVAGTVPEAAATIAVIDQRFTLQAIAGAKIWLNGARSSVPAGRPIVLNDNDTLSIGELRISIRTSDTSEEEGRDLNALVNPRDRRSEGLVIDGEFAASNAAYPATRPVVDDPLAALDKAAIGGGGPAASAGHTILLDPLDSLGSPVDMLPMTPASTQESDGRVEINSAVAFQKVSSFLFDAESDEIGDPPPRVPVPGSLTSPRGSLTRALGLSQPGSDETELGADVAAALRAAIEGLNGLFLKRATSAGHFPPMRRYAVEDNPLRLAVNGQAAIDSLFGEPDSLRLSPSAAIAESLEDLGHHQDATESAVDLALNAVLSALGPEVLARRFASCAQPAGQPGDAEHDAWCWRMFRTYFRELASHRQGGLQALFWEIFAEEYQTAMRALSAGNINSPTAERHK
ncbi:MAG: type VI secretion system-associated FHA domain protein TagH [Rhizobiaceae bacterium]|nr:type VI secretion system-associated FHA domain protein TagH [Rhizobiaceae bacterium]